MKKILTSHGRLVAMLASMLLFSLAVLAQETHPVSGTVLDEKGAPLQGVSVVIKGTTLGTVTDTAGRFTIRVGKGATLVFSYIKYGTQEIPIKAERTVTISMTPTTSSLNDVIVVGYGTQRKATLTGAVAQIGNAEIVTTKNENIENMLTGKVPGLQILQNTAEPGDFANNISIRGMGNPIIVIDGVVMNDFSITGNNGDNNVGTSNILSRLDPNDIESISVLKDASAAVYGIRSANGVIMVTTKKGKAGTMELSYNGTYGVQVPSGLPKPVDALQYMQLVNQQDLHNANGGIISYDSADFAAYRNGTLKTTDWYDAVFKKRTPQMQHNITATGGNENTTYLISAGYLYQDGLLTSNDLNYHRYNVRSNITTKIGKRFTVNLNVSGIMDKKNQPAESFWWTTRETWRELPTQTIYANNTAPYYTNGLVDGGNPVAFENSDIVGYNNLSNTWINAAISIDYKVPFLEGLTLRGFFSYNDQIQDNKLYQKSFDLYNYNDATQTYKATLNGSPSYVQRQYYRYPQNDDQFSLNYAHSFGNHNITALLLMEGAEQSADNFASYRQLSIPVDQLIAGNAANQNATQDGGNTALYQYATNSWVGRVTYDFSSRYLAEFSFRDDKSSKFAPGQGWGFFPSGSIGWRINEENFFRNSNKLSFIDNLKLRASYGLTGSDGPLYYQFLTGYTYPASGNNNQLPRGSVFGNNFINAVQSTGIPNPNVTWIRAHTFDAGIDFDAWKGLLGFTVDYFRRDLKGILATSVLQVPEVLGAPLPEEN
ncbi:MAG TPA: SusC/RagA family TonB-linked outer membrane protein, partial [Puia sp.]|nr:SusC/RagA family TonB-linked outer membrane protein [Puia sp.]